MTSSTSWAELNAADRTGHCARPIRLVTHAEGRDEIVLVACRTRRGRLCPACSDRYKLDAFQLLAAGMRGGKGVPETVSLHPMAFLTATAPGFGPVHAIRGEALACRPRKSRPLCPHGRPAYCFEVHREDDSLIGSPLCVECFDYEGVVIFNASVSALWQRALVGCYRSLAALVGMTERELRQQVRISYQKVCEFQKRGAVHLHAVVRLDAAEPPPSSPPERFDGALLCAALAGGVRRARLPFPPLPGRGGELLTFGGASGTAVVELRLSPEDATKIAAYLGKYAIKSVAEGLERRIRSKAEIDKLGLPPHLRTVVETAWKLGGRRALRPLALRRVAHQLGHGGHILTKSRYWSTTFGALREDRRSWRDSHLGEEHRERSGEEVWRFVGVGYDRPDTAHLALALAEMDRRARMARPRRTAHEVPAEVSPEENTFQSSTRDEEQN